MGSPEVRGSITLGQGDFATLGMLHAHAVEVAKTEFAKGVGGNREPFQCPFLWLVKTQRVLLTVETPWANDDEKIRSMNMMRHYMAMTNATAYSFIHEAWMAVYTEANKDSMPRRMPNSVSALPPHLREDVLICWTFDRSAKQMMTRWGVKRAGTPRAKLLVQDDVPEDGVDHFEGRMFNLLLPERPMTMEPGDPIWDEDKPKPGLGPGAAFAVTCPHCGKQHDLASAIDHPHAIPPKDDDVVLCVACGQWGKVDSRVHGGARKLTEAESFAIGFDDRLRDVRRAWMEAKKELAEKVEKS